MSDSILLTALKTALLQKLFDAQEKEGFDSYVAGHATNDDGAEIVHISLRGPVPEKQVLARVELSTCASETALLGWRMSYQSPGRADQFCNFLLPVLSWSKQGSERYEDLFQQLLLVFREGLAASKEKEAA